MTILNQTAANLLFGSESVVGKRVLWGGDTRYHTIIGVVADVHQFGLDQAPPPAMYLSTAQHPSSSAILMVRTTDETYAPLAEATVRGWNPDLALQGGRWMDTVVDDALGVRRYTTGASMVFALTALLVAIVGIYGVFSQWTLERTHELGIRMALGGPDPDDGGTAVRCPHTGRRNLPGRDPAPRSGSPGGVCRRSSWRPHG